MGEGSAPRADCGVWPPSNLANILDFSLATCRTPTHPWSSGQAWDYASVVSSSNVVLCLLPVCDCTLGLGKLCLLKPGGSSTQSIPCLLLHLLCNSCMDSGSHRMGRITPTTRLLSLRRPQRIPGACNQSVKAEVRREESLSFHSPRSLRGSEDPMCYSSLGT